MRIVFILTIIILFNTISVANVGSDTGLELPRYVSLKSNDANIRVGPSKNYPIIIKYILKNFPLKVIEEYKDWRKIIDFENNTGWIHKSLITGERNGIINSNNQKNVFIYNTYFGKKIGEIHHRSLIKISKCKLDWCMIIVNHHKGWIKKNNIWGVNSDEIFNYGYLQKVFHYYHKSLNFFEDHIF